LSLHGYGPADTALRKTTRQGGKIGNLKQLIAIVDDDQSAREAVTSLVRALGFEAAAFASAADFLHSPESGQTACLIVDMRMPGMNGLDLYRHLVVAGAPPPTVLITAHPEDGGRERALAAGLRFYLSKPLDPNELLGCIRAALGQDRPE
jgi:FixJ family two-component response regulator